MSQVGNELSSKLSQSRFQAALGSTFDVLPGNGAPAVSLKLVEVSIRRAPKSYEQFAALFEGPHDPLLAQATYTLSHPGFGTMSLFVVPVGRSAHGVSYEACVVRRVSENEPGD